MDLGSGPGRFAPFVGAPTARVVLVDLSQEALKRARNGLRGPPLDRFAPVRADALHLPFRSGLFAEVVVLGNLLGTAGPSLGKIVSEVERVLMPRARLVMEIVPGAGERSAYLSRLPPGAVRRTLNAPRGWLTARILREGFRSARASVPARDRFRRISVEEIRGLLGIGWTAREIVAVAPALGFEPERLEALRSDATAWQRLLALEEGLGRAPERWPKAAALLAAFDRAGPEGPGRRPA